MIQKYSELKTGKGYVSIRLRPKDARALHKIVRGLGIVNGLKPDEYHCTLIYDKTNPTIPFEAPTKIFHAKLDTPLVLGPGVRDALVLMLKDCPELTELHRYLLRIGYKHSFPTFSPHISLKYHPTRSDVAKVQGAFRDKILPELARVELQHVTCEVLS